MTDPTTRRQRVLFIGGLGRSGSTLVEKLINELGPTHSVGETVHLWERGLRDRERCGCGEPFEQCRQWSAVGQRAFGGWDQVDVERLVHLRWTVDRTRRLPLVLAALRSGRSTPGQREYLHALRSVLLASAEVAAKERGSDPDDIVLIDSSKHLSTAALLACDDRLDLRILHLVRDPRGVAYSWTKAVDRPETEGELMPQYSPARTAARWVSDNLGFELLGRLGVRILRRRYEDVVAAPTEALVEIARFAGIDAGPTFPFLHGQSAHLSTPMHSIAGNPLRFGGDNVMLRVDDAWRTELPAAERRTVDRVTGPVLARYGYSRSD